MFFFFTKMVVYDAFLRMHMLFCHKIFFFVSIFMDANSTTIQSAKVNNPLLDFSHSILCSYF